MEIREVYHLGGASSAFVGDTKVWANYDEYCYTQSSANTGNYCYIRGTYTSPTTVFRIWFNPSSASNGGTMFGGNTTDDNWDYRFFWSSKKPYLDIGTSRISGPYDANFVGRDYAWEFGNYYIKDLTTGNYIVTGATKADADVPELSIRINLGYGKVYKAEVWDNGILQCELVPAQWSDGVKGMYDDVQYWFHPASNQNITMGTCSEDPFTGSTSGSTTGSTGNWYLVPETNSEADWDGSDYVFFYSGTSQTYALMVTGNNNDGYSLSVRTGLTVTQQQDGSFLIPDGEVGYYGKFNYNSGGLKVKGSTSAFLRADNTQYPNSVSAVGVSLGGNEDVYKNQSGNNVYINFVNQGWCWALRFKRFYWDDEHYWYSPGGFKCSGANQSSDGTPFFLYKLVRR